MPPSVNKIYVRRRGGGLALSAAAKEYRERVKKAVVAQLAAVNKLPTDLSVRYGLEFVAAFTEVENPGWFQTFTRGAHAGERKSKMRYKKIDADNRIKFAQDALIQALGIPDDAQVFEVRISKRKSDKPNGAEYLSVKVMVL